jgi:hypothetical protein
MTSKGHCSIVLYREQWRIILLRFFIPLALDCTYAQAFVLLLPLCFFKRYVSHSTYTKIQMLKNIKHQNHANPPTAAVATEHRSPTMRPAVHHPDIETGIKIPT